MYADLATMQAQFAAALVDADQVAPLLAELRGNSELNRERFAFYRGNIRAIWLQSCTTAYPVLQRLVGAEFFEEMAQAYGTAQPSRSGDLTEFAAGIPEFIRTLDSCRDFPYLSDVGSLEWLIHRSYYQQHQTPVTLAVLATVPGNKLADVRCALQPWCALFESEWAIVDIWTAHQHSEPIFPKEVRKRSTSLVFRQSSWKVHAEEISTGSYAALRALQAGETLGVAVESALSADPEFAVQSAMADWFHRQLILSITTD